MNDSSRTARARPSPSSSATRVDRRPASAATPLVQDWPKTYNARKQPTDASRAARLGLELDLHKASKGKDRVTSRHRDHSPAHRYDAVDLQTKQMTPEQRHQHAEKRSWQLGKSKTVNVEEVYRDAKSRPSFQVSTPYRNGKQGTVKIEASGPGKADATHTHVQTAKELRPKDK